MNKTILEKVPDAEKAAIKSSISKYVDSYSKEKAQQQLQGLKSNTIEGAKLAKDLKTIMISCLLKLWVPLIKCLLQKRTYLLKVKKSSVLM